MQDRVIIIGYGNPDRGDDGVAWHIMIHLAKKLGRDIPTFEEGFTMCGESPELFFTLQLMPEIAEMISLFDRVCFIDAHTGHVSDNVHIEYLHPQFQPSPLTHHLTPMTCLELTNVIYKKKPGAILVSVRGYDFGFMAQLSPKTSEHAEEAVDFIWNWIFVSEI
jgi:hydrogenase maturation protease